MLITRVITFELTPKTHGTSTSRTDGQTDRRADNLLYQHRTMHIVHRAVKTKASLTSLKVFGPSHKNG